MGMVEKAAKEADPELADYILKGVTEGLSYDVIKARMNIPCCKDVYLFEAYITSYMANVLSKKLIWNCATSFVNICSMPDS